MKDLRLHDIVEVRHKGVKRLGEIISDVYYTYDRYMMAYPVVDVNIPGEGIVTIQVTKVNKYERD